MSDVSLTRPALADAVHPPAIALREIWPWAVLGLVLLLQLYIVGVDEGAMSLTHGSGLHEWVHDGRHLLGFPCH